MTLQVSKLQSHFRDVFLRVSLNNYQMYRVIYFVLISDSEDTAYDIFREKQAERNRAAASTWVA